MISTNFIDLDHRWFKHCCGLSDFWRLLDPSQLIHGYGEIGTRCQLDIMPINFEELFSEIASDVMTSLLIGCTTADGHSGGSVCLFRATLGAVGVPALPSGMLGVGLTIPGSAIAADHEELLREMLGDGGGVSDGLGDCFGDGLGGAF